MRCARHSWCWINAARRGIENGHLLVGPIAIEGAMPGRFTRSAHSLGRTAHSLRRYAAARRDGVLRQTENERPPNKVTILDSSEMSVFEPWRRGGAARPFRR